MAVCSWNIGGYRLSGLVTAGKGFCQGQQISEKLRLLARGIVRPQQKQLSTFSSPVYAIMVLEVILYEVWHIS